MKIKLGPLEIDDHGDARWMILAMIAIIYGTIAVIIIASVFATAIAEGSELTCPGEPEPIHYGNCSGQPENDKINGVHKFEHGGVTYPLTILGNETELLTRGGTRITGSRCRVPNVGDHDYGLHNAIHCPDCPHMWQSYIQTVCAFEVGEYMGKPRFGSGTLLGASSVLGGFTWMIDGAQCVILQASDLPSCGGFSGVYRVDGSGVYTLVECMPGRRIVAGRRLGLEYLVLVDQTQRVFIYRIDAGPTLVLAAWLDSAHAVQDWGFDLDGTTLALANRQGVQFYDVSNPELPTQVGTLAPIIRPFPLERGWNRIDIEGARMVVSRSGIVGSAQLYDVSDLTAPVLLHEFEPLSLACATDEGVELLGDMLWRAGYAEGWRYEIGACAKPVPSVVFVDGFESNGTGEWG